MEFVKEFSFRLNMMDFLISFCIYQCKLKKKQRAPEGDVLRGQHGS